MILPELGCACRAMRGPALLRRPKRDLMGEIMGGTLSGRALRRLLRCLGAVCTQSQSDECAHRRLAGVLVCSGFCTALCHCCCPQ